MKYLLILILIFSTINAQEDKKQKLTIGLGPYIQTQPYKNVDNIVIASPVLFFDNELIYIRWSRAGIYFFGDSQEDYSWGFSLTVQPRVNGYDSSDILGMHTRKSTWEGGLAFSAKTEDMYIEIMALTDILDRYESFIIRTEVGYDLEFNNFSIYPSLILLYQSADFTDYYYGVRYDEQLYTRKAYKPSAGLEVGIQTYIKYPITDNFSALVNLRVDRLSREAAHSPIVDKNYIFSGLASLIYTFQY